MLFIPALSTKKEDKERFQEYEYSWRIKYNLETCRYKMLLYRDRFFPSTFRLSYDYLWLLLWSQVAVHVKKGLQL